MAATSSSVPFEVVLKNELQSWARRQTADGLCSTSLTSRSNGQLPGDAPASLSSASISPAMIVLLHVHRQFCASSLEFLGAVKDTFSRLVEENPASLESFTSVLCRLFIYWCEAPSERSDLVSSDGRPRPTLRGVIVYIEKLEKQWPRVRKYTLELKLTILRATNQRNKKNAISPVSSRDQISIPRSMSSGISRTTSSGQVVNRERDSLSSLHSSQKLPSSEGSGSDTASNASAPAALVPVQSSFERYFLEPATLIIATALTHIEFQRFRRINCTELLSHTKRMSANSKAKEKQNEDKDKDKDFSDSTSTHDTAASKHSNIAHMIKRTNGFVFWLANRVLSPSLSNDDRVSLLQRCIQLAADCVELRNYSTAMSLLSLLNMRQISRLRKIIDALSPKYRSLWQQLDELFDGRGNFSQYRSKVAAHLAKGEFVLPFLGVFLRDCTFIDEVHQWRIETTQKEVLFNAEKLNLMLGLVNQFSLMQQKNFQPSLMPTKSYAEMSHFFRSAEIQLTASLITDEKLDDLSYAIEPPKRLLV